jgi:hypothetical protein
LEQSKLLESACFGKSTTMTEASPLTHPTQQTCPSPRVCSPSCWPKSTEVLKDEDHALGNR